jgi:hypothetical protein
MTAAIKFPSMRLPEPFDPTPGYQTPEPAIVHRAWSPHTYGMRGNCGCETCVRGALAASEVRLAGAWQLLKRIHEWDHMDTAADGSYWRAEIEKLTASAR